MHRIAVLALPEVVAFDLSVPAQVFGHPEERERYLLTTCAVEPGQVPTTTGFTLGITHGLEAVRDADTVVVPGFWPYHDPPSAAVEALNGAAARGARVMSICTGAFALAAAGLLDGRRATTHWQDAPVLASRFPRVMVEPDVLYLDEGPILTSAGIAAGLDLCVHVIRTDHGAQVAAQAARRLVVAPHRTGGQVQLLRRPDPPAGSAGVAQTCAWAMARLDQRLTVADLARHAGWAPRTFARRFVAETGLPPMRWLTAQRLLEARRLLEATDLGVDAIARRTGVGTAANLRKLFTHDIAMTPTAYRAGHRTPPDSARR